MNVAVPVVGEPFVMVVVPSVQVRSIIPIASVDSKANETTPSRLFVFVFG